MKRPRIALCLLMALFATSLYAVGFAADRENLADRYGDANWADEEEEADLCEFAYEDYCEYAYDRPADYSYDGCTAGDDDSASISEDENCQAFPPAIDELDSPSLDDEEIGLSDEEGASLDAAILDYECENAYAEDLAENPEPQDFDQATWCGRYCLAREVQAPAAPSLPNGAIRNFVERVSDAVVQLFNESRGDVSLSDSIPASQSGLPLASGLKLLEGGEWSAANAALAAGTNRWVVIDPLPLPAANLELLIGPPQPVTLRALARPLARLAVGMRASWQQAWSAIGDLATEGDAVPEVSSRPQSEVANPPSDPGRDTRTSQRRNPRRVEI